MKKPPLAGGSGIDLGGMRTCTWTVWFSPAEYAGLTLTQAADFTTGRFSDAQDVPGVGSGAYWEPSLNELVVAIPKGTLTALVNSSTVDQRTAAYQLATLAAPRI